MTKDIRDDSTFNQVALRGRLGAEAEFRELPSGDVLVAFRLTVDRPEGERGRVDSIECTSVRARVRRSLSGAAPGDLVEVKGSLRRRFWRGPHGPASRYSVDTESVRITRVGRRAGASPSRKQASV